MASRPDIRNRHRLFAPDIWCRCSWMRGMDHPEFGVWHLPQPDLLLLDPLPAPRCLLTLSISFGLHRQANKRRWRSERLGRQQCVRKVETEKLLCTVFVAQGDTAPGHEHGRSSAGEDVLQDHPSPPASTRPALVYLGTESEQSSRSQQIASESVGNPGVLNKRPPKLDGLPFIAVNASDHQS